METDGRSAIILKPKQPYADWAKSLSEPGEAPVKLASLRSEVTVHLVEEIVGPDHFLEILEFEYEDMFREQLNGWSRDDSQWPEIRDLQMFLDWFEVEWGSMVFDLTV